MGSSDINGDVSLALNGKRPKVVGNLAAAKVDLKDFGVHLESEVITHAQTGVEMEALTAVSVAALTVYDMCKAIDKSMTITEVRLELKTGGKSGDYRRE